MQILKRAIIAAIVALAFPSCASASSCPALRSLVNRAADASAALADCIKATPSGGHLELPAGKLLIQGPITIVKPINLSTAGVADGDRSCGELGDRVCSVLVIDAASATHPNRFAIDVRSNGVSVSHLMFQGTGNARAMADCRAPASRAYLGGLRALGSNFAVRKSVFRNFACHSALQVRAGHTGLTIQDNLIGPNGNHAVDGMWSDGITIHDTQGAVIERNRFVDNTDVQLIFAGCRNCRITGNQFRHRGAFTGASFAEIMLNTFPGSSGNFAGTIISGNDIDCGSAKLCGYGIMVGSGPWLPAANKARKGEMSGGTITRNVIRNAIIAVDVDAPSGPVQISGNRIFSSGGVRSSDCGRRQWPAINVAPESVRFVSGDIGNGPQGRLKTLGCLVNRRSN